MLTSLPTEILVHIFSHLPGKDLSAVSQTCRLIHSVSYLDSLWQGLCRPLTRFSPYRNWHELYSTLWFRSGWLVGVWFVALQNERTIDMPQGGMIVMRYNNTTGLIDCHVHALVDP